MQQRNDTPAIYRTAGFQTAIANGLLAFHWLVGQQRAAAMSIKLSKQFAQLEGDIPVPDFIYTDAGKTDSIIAYERGIEEGYALLRRLIDETFPDREPLGNQYVERVLWRIGLKHLMKSEVLKLRTSEKIAYIVGNGPNRIEAIGSLDVEPTASISLHVHEYVYAGDAIDVTNMHLVMVNLDGIYLREYSYVLSYPGVLIVR